MTSLLFLLFAFSKTFSVGWRPNYSGSSREFLLFWSHLMISYDSVVYFGFHINNFVSMHVTSLNYSFSNVGLFKIFLNLLKSQKRELSRYGTNQWVYIFVWVLIKNHKRHVFLFPWELQKRSIHRVIWLVESRLFWWNRHACFHCFIRSYASLKSDRIFCLVFDQENGGVC